MVVELTRRGRLLWREMNVTYRRAVQRHFAGWLGDATSARCAAVLEKVAPAIDLTVARSAWVVRRTRGVRFAP